MFIFPLFSLVAVLDSGCLPSRHQVGLHFMGFCGCGPIVIKLEDSNIE